MPQSRIASFVAGVALIVPISSAAQRPVTVPADVRAACDFVNKIIATTPGIKVRRTTGSFALEMLTAPVTGCRVDIDGSMKRLGTVTCGNAAVFVRPEDR